MARGRKPKESPLSLRVREAMQAHKIPSVAALEERAGLPVDGFRDILRGRVGRNKAVKLATIERVASILKVPPSELATLAGLVTMDGRRIDHGTVEVQMKRQTLAAGGDPRLCHSALGVLLAHGEVEGRLGITEAMRDTGEKFADLVARPLPGAPKRPRSELERFAYPGGRHDADLESMELRTDTARMAWKALLAGDVAMARQMRLPRPSAMVWAVAVQGRLPPWADPLACGPWPSAALAQWLALRTGLRVLRHHFARNENHRAAALALKERREAHQWGDVAHQMHQAQAMLARKGVRA